METFRGKTIILPRTRDYRLIDETDKYSKEQRLQCQTETGKVCTLYPFPVGMKIIQMFRPKRWLDPTAGWGDRLRVAIASNVEYVGVDSNKSMKPAYQAIIRNLAKDDKYAVKIGKFQNVKIEGMFDLVFTSPPFFTVEVYQHMVQWDSVNHFMSEFLKPMLRKSHKHLSKHGHLVLYIEDRPDALFIQHMKDYVSTFEDMRYEGVIYYEGGKPRPYYVWKKV